jgi:hypothetical protein
VTIEPERADLLIAAVRSARRAGNPVPGPDPQRWQRVIRVALRRWSTFTRRHPAPAPDTLSARAEDLARGLLARCGPRTGSGAPIEITDCRHLARRLAHVLSTAPTGRTGGGSHPSWAPR